VPYGEADAVFSDHSMQSDMAGDLRLRDQRSMANQFPSFVRAFQQCASI